MTKPSSDRLTPYDCSNCGDPVQARRPSQNGDHFCTKRECVNAKQKLYYNRRKKARLAAAEHVATIDDVDQERRAFVEVAIHRPRIECPVCGLPDGVGGWVHRDARKPMQAGCSGLGGNGKNLGLPWLDAVHPDLVSS